MKTIEEYEQLCLKRNCIYVCKKCNESIILKPDSVWWVEHGTYSEKVTRCPECGCVNVVKYQEGFNQNPNFDERYFK